MAHGEAGAEGRVRDAGADAAVGVVELKALRPPAPMNNDQVCPRRPGRRPASRRATDGRGAVRAPEPVRARQRGRREAVGRPRLVALLPPRPARGYFSTMRCGFMISTFFLSLTSYESARP